MRKKRALITGISGQDGSYLAEHLLDLGYEVCGMLRRHSVAENQDSRIMHLADRITTYYGDLSDASSIEKIIKESQPDEIYNLGAMSHVRISADIPLYTVQINALGVANMLETYRKFAPNARFYQASSSEIFGNNFDEDKFQRETTLKDPVSVYGCSKLFSFNMVRYYRRAFGLFCSNGILHNHESIPKNSPVIIMDKNELIEILPIEDLFRTDKHKYEGLLDEYIGSSVWNGEEWTKILNGNCYKDKNKSMKIVQTVGGSYEATHDHVVFDENNNEIETKNLHIGQNLRQISFPELSNKFNNDLDLCKFIGFLVAEGHISEDGNIRLTGCDKEILIQMANLICDKFGWKYRINTYGPGNFENCTNNVWQLDINNDSSFGKWIREHIYTSRNSEKKIPKFILNGNKDICQSFFDGYYLGDGRKAGWEKYDYKGWTTSSATLCLGLIYILSKFSPNQIAKVKCDYRMDEGKFVGRYYYCQLTTDVPTNRGQNFIKNKNEIVKIIDTKSEDGWFYDLTTESKTFATGPNLIKIHNSPRRGSNFVTSKVVKGAVEISVGMAKDLIMGNLEASRDWGHSWDYVRAMHLILNHSEPDDFTVATGEAHSVRELCEYVFGKLGMDYKEYVKQDPKLLRPEELKFLRGDSTKARTVLGWKPEYTFKTLLDEMVDYWLNFYNVSKTQTAPDNKWTGIHNFVNR